MLICETTVTFFGNSKSVRYKIEITNVGGGALADYEVCLFDEEHMSCGHLYAYPRWSEDAGGLVARALLSVLDEERRYVAQFTDDQQRISTLSMDVFISNPRPWSKSRHCLERISVWTDDNCYRLEANRAGRSPKHQTSHEGPPTHWFELAIQTLSWSAWGQTMVPAWPAPISVPVFDSGSYHYVRERDLPEPAKSEFLSRAKRSGRPLDGAFHVDDWKDFLAGAF